MPCLDALAAGVRARRAQVAEKRALTRSSSPTQTAAAAAPPPPAQDGGDVSVTGSQVPGIAA